MRDCSKSYILDTVIKGAWTEMEGAWTLLGQGLDSDWTGLDTAWTSPGRLWGSMDAAKERTGQCLGMDWIMLGGSFGGMDAPGTGPGE